MGTYCSGKDKEHDNNDDVDKTRTDLWIWLKATDFFFGGLVKFFCLADKYVSENNDCISEHLMYPDCAETFRTTISKYYLHEHKTWPPNEVLSLVGSRNVNKGDEITFNFSTFPQTKHVRQTKQYLLNFCFQCHLSNSRPCQPAAYGTPKTTYRPTKISYSHSAKCCWIAAGNEVLKLALQILTRQGGYELTLH